MKNKKFSFAVLLALALALFVSHVDTANAAPLSDEAFIELVRTGTAQEVEAAISAGANVNAVGDIWAALTWAVRFNPHIEVVTVLISNGANVNARDEIRGNTALTWALSDLSNFEMINVLIEAGANVNSELLSKIWNGFEMQAIVFLLANGADVNVASASWDGRTALMTAVLGNDGLSQPDVVTILIEHGADVNARDDNGNTALMWAAERWFPPSPLPPCPFLESMEILLANAADVSMRNNDGKRAIDIARNNPNLANTEALRMLEAASR